MQTFEMRTKSFLTITIMQRTGAKQGLALNNLCCAIRDNLTSDVLRWTPCRKKPDRVRAWSTDELRGRRVVLGTCLEAFFSKHTL